MPGSTRGEPAAFSSALDIVRSENPALQLTVSNVDVSALFINYQLQAANGVPDLFIAPNDTAGDLARAGLAANLDQYFSADELSRFSDLALSGSRVDGTLIQVPESLRAVAFFYDTDKITAFPATTDELLAAVRNGDFRLGLDQDIYHVFGFWGSFGGQLMDETGRCIADRTGVGNAYAYYAALKDAGAMWFRGGEGSAAFNSGTVDAIIEAPFLSDSFRQSHPTNLGVAPLPAGPGGPALPLVGVDGWTINPNSPRIDLAVALAKRMVQPDILGGFADLAAHVPADPSVASSDPLSAQFAAALQFGLPRPQLPQLGAFWGSFGLALNHVVDDGADPQQAVADACAEMNP